MKTAWLIAALSLFPAQLPSQSQAQHGLVLANDNVTFLAPLGRGKMRWTGNYLAGCDFCVGGAPIIWAVDRQGIRKSVAFRIPGAGYIGVHDVAAGDDGSLSAVGLAISDDSRMSSFIARISANMESQTLIQSWPYTPEVITVAPDGSVWTVGEILTESRNILTPNLLRHYSQSGQVLSSTHIQYAKMSAGGMRNVSLNSMLMMSSGRIGWLTASCQYIEFSLTGVEMGRYGCPNAISDITQLAGSGLSAGGDLLVEPEWNVRLGPLQLDRATNTWNAVPVQKDVAPTHTVLGFDGPTLVTSAASPQGRGAVMRRYNWLDAAPGQ